MTQQAGQGRPASRRYGRVAHRRAAAGRVAAGGFAAALAAAGFAGAGPAAAASGARALAAARATPTTTVRGWGTNDDGELGHGTSSLFAETPVTAKLPKGVTVTSVRAGCDHTVALTSAGGALAWGDNSEGQVGDGTTKSRRTPVRVKLPAGTKLTAVRAGCDHTIALTKSGSVLAWGFNKFGELGDGTSKDRNTPVKVKLPKGVKVKAISAGCDQNLALTTKGKVYAWGLNLYGEIGDGTTKNRHTPVAVKLPAGTRATIVAAGCAHSLAQTSTGLYGWGENAEGQLGDGSTTSTDMPVLIPLLFRGPPPGKITGLFAGCQHSLALFAKGALLAWGENGSGQLGNGTTTSSDKPVGVMLPTGTKVKSVSAGCDSSLALTATGKVLAWGYNAQGELGDDSTSDSDVPVAVDLPASLGGIAIGSGPGAEHSFVIEK
jgi:alpha-tubulin suppressor-like RCC1 family protein